MASPAVDEEYGDLPEKENGEGGIHVFYLHLAGTESICHPDQGVFDRFMKLDKLNRKRAMAIAKFWHSKAKSNHREEMHENLKSAVSDGYKKYPHPKNDLAKRTEYTLALVRKKDKWLHYSYLYENWARIAAMIDANIKAEERGDGE
ncbi:hypothetical protein NT6N_30450 [Oceaniferula spumae]|uniref:Uncharacterized protein n=1 Tax=Oceaniferula spumae TaxID=2979115 RepID=A0AAT9FPP6_9BACT